ncbi:MAG: hypothetical protein J6T18_01030 [Bacteroidaceae bacterium]|nr:hypothetical protein [Bacteroidaceae bacterium]
MKRCPFPVLLVLLLVMTAVSCRKERNRFVLNGIYSSVGSAGTDSMILVTGIDSRFDRTDTVFPAGGSFTWSFTPDTITPLLLVFPDGTCQAVFADKGLTAQMTIPDSGNIVISGGYCNDSYQSFKDRVYEGMSRSRITECIDSFIKADPFSEVTPMLIYEYLVMRYHFDRKEIEPLVRKMSGNMQDSPFLVNLKSGFGSESTGNNYISAFNLIDTSMVKKPFTGISENQHLLVCIWASWDERSNEARKEMVRFRDFYSDRVFNIADISLDVNPGRWKEVVAGDTLEWESYCDTEGWNSRLIREGQIRELPVYVLFSGVKRIILKTNSLTEMDIRLDEELPKKRKTGKTEPRKFRITGL